MATTHLPKKSMRNRPSGDIADFSANLKISYCTNCIDLEMEHSTEFKNWENTAIKKLARQGKNFELTSIVNGVSVTVRGKRI